MGEGGGDRDEGDGGNGKTKKGEEEMEALRQLVDVHVMGRSRKDERARGQQSRVRPGGVARAVCHACIKGCTPARRALSNARAPCPTEQDWLMVLATDICQNLGGKFNADNPRRQRQQCENN